MGPNVDLLGEEVEGGGAVPSCRLDWLSVTFFAATVAKQREQILYFTDLLEALTGSTRMAEGGGRRFFQESWYHPAGLALRWTEPGGTGTNAGLLSVDLKGSLLASLDAPCRKALYMDILDIEGFKACTRLDVQRTVVNPHADADEIYRRVSAKEVWIPKFSGYRPGALVDADGRQVSGCTITWGSPKGLTHAKTYDKRAQLKGIGEPAARHELVHRKQPARDRFIDLVGELQQEAEQEETRAESRFVQSNLAQSMTYLDTSRLKHIPRDQWPKNWARDSKAADFWSEVVTGEVKEYRTQWRFQTALEKAIANRNHQYGRLGAKWACYRVWVDGQSLANVQQDELDQQFVRLRDEDIEEVLDLVPEEHRSDARAWMFECRNTASRNIENGEGLKGPA